MSLALGLYPKHTEVRESPSTDFTQLWIEPFKDVKQSLELLRLWMKVGYKNKLFEFRTQRGSLNYGISKTECQNYTEKLHLLVGKLAA